MTDEQMMVSRTKAYEAGRRGAQEQVDVLGDRDYRRELSAHDEVRRADRRDGRFESAAFHAGVIDVLTEHNKAFTARQLSVSVL